MENQTDKVPVPRYPTPVTDANLCRYTGGELVTFPAGLGCGVVPAEVARDLENRLTVAEQRLAQHEPMQGHNEPCYYCGKPCNGLHGNPGLWPIPLCHTDEPGRVKWHHIHCVCKRLVENLKVEWATLDDAHLDLKCGVDLLRASFPTGSLFLTLKYPEFIVSTLQTLIEAKKHERR